VIAHGVYSWVPPLARTQLLAAMARHLAPDGLAFVSYATYPGAHLREIAREMLQYHGRGGGEPMLRVARALEFVRNEPIARPVLPMWSSHCPQSCVPWPSSIVAPSSTRCLRRRAPRC
jgi:hypothetical protein